ncbi:hypothetical protein [Bradyrhizobium sp. OAE829]
MTGFGVIRHFVFGPDGGLRCRQSAIALFAGERRMLAMFENLINGLS